MIESKSMVPERMRLLFWDIDTASFDPAAYPVYAIKRVLEYGDEDAIRWMRGLFNDTAIRDVLRTHHRLTPRSATFWALVFGVPRHEVAALTANGARPGS